MQHIEHYFAHDAASAAVDTDLALLDLLPLPLTNSHPELDMDVRALLAYVTRALPGVTPTPRALARVLHGIGSPGWPVSQWSKHRDWGRRRDVAFEAVMARAAAVLKEARDKMNESDIEMDSS